MCGITGFWDKSGLSKPELISIVDNMSKQIENRGPDSSGHWVEEKLGLAFGHRRLSVIDLSPNGHQPMISQSQNLILSYNGEIYNASEIRSELEHKGCQFRGTSDTEVILEACETWGVEETCKKINGMFAFSLWDNKNQTLFLARDRIGKKPLYWGYHKSILFFGSQLKSFRAHPKWQPAIDTEALTSYFRVNYVPAPYSIFKGIYKLKPGTILSFDKEGNPKETCFWSFEEIVQKGLSSRSTSSDKELTDELESLLKDAVKRRMVADVPLGAFLSGGIDSSTVVSLMQAQSNKPIKTFSIGFYEDAYNEAQYAAKVAKHLGTEHHELYLHANDAQSIIPSIPTWCDEPFADSSQIPTFLLSRMAREHVTVSLSGDGGDELFAGYNRYLTGYKLWQAMKILPFWLRRMSATSIRSVSPKHWERFSNLIPEKMRPRLFSDKLTKLSNVLTATTTEQFYRILVSLWDKPQELVLGGKEPYTTYPRIGDRLSPKMNFIERMQYMDTLSYLPDDILAKVDRASMAVSLEGRVPILDHRVIEFAWKLPLSAKVREGKGKWLLRQVLNRYLPKELVERPKMGFGVPIDQWLRGPLREWAENYLSEKRLKQEGLLKSIPIQEKWKEHKSGERDWQYALWGVLMFQAWRECWKI